MVLDGLRSFKCILVHISEGGLRSILGPLISFQSYESDGTDGWDGMEWLS